MSGAELRITPRRRLQVKALVLTADGRHVVGRTLDLSVTGLGLTLSVNFAPGTTVAVAFDLPMRPHGFWPVRAHARVVHSILDAQSGDFRLGLRWVNVNDETLQRLQAFSVAAPATAPEADS